MRPPCRGPRSWLSTTRSRPSRTLGSQRTCISPPRARPQLEQGAGTSRRPVPGPQQAPSLHRVLPTRQLTKSSANAIGGLLRSELAPPRCRGGPWAVPAKNSLRPGRERLEGGPLQGARVRNNDANHSAFWHALGQRTGVTRVSRKGLGRLRRLRWFAHRRRSPRPHSARLRQAAGGVRREASPALPGPCPEHTAGAQACIFKACSADCPATAQRRTSGSWRGLCRGRVYQSRAFRHWGAWKGARAASPGPAL